MNECLTMVIDYYCNLQRGSESDSQRERLLERERAVNFELTLAMPAALLLNTKTI